MLIYDYSKELSLSALLLGLITTICIITLILLVMFGIRAIMKKSGAYRITVLSLATAIVMIISGFVSWRTFNIIKFYYICESENNESVSGQLEIVSVKRDDYRDEELYTIDFRVDNLYFHDTVNSFSAEQKDLLTTVDSDIEVRYSHIGNELAIYQIRAREG